MREEYSNTGETRPCEGDDHGTGAVRRARLLRHMTIGQSMSASKKTAMPTGT